MPQYYIHKIGSQEMGSVERNNGVPQRGRYFLISKKCLEFFPYLSSVVLNDKASIFIVPTYAAENIRVLCTLDYHNQRSAQPDYQGDNPRNEVRLYMNQQIDPELYFRTDDLAVFERLDVEDEIIYCLTRIRQTEEGYDYLCRKLEENDRHHHSNIICNDELPFIQRPTITAENVGDTPIEIPDNNAERYLEAATDNILTQENNENTIFEQMMGAQLFNRNTFRQFVLTAYQYKCAITGKVIRYNDLCNLEAAHIKPQAHNGLFLPCNGIAMSRDMHFAFDKGFFTIDNDYNVLVAEALINTDFYNEYHGTRIFVPQVDYFKPRREYLEYHRSYIFQTFTQIRHL